MTRHMFSLNENRALESPIRVATPEGFEPPTPGSEDQLSAIHRCLYLFILSVDPGLSRVFYS